MSDARKLDGESLFAIILGCSDSRVPAELVFNCGLGELFVIRVAGNVATPTQIGSVEFACQHFGAELVVVLGHTHCGAVSATVDCLAATPDDLSPNVAAIVDCVTPAVQPIVEDSNDMDREELLLKSMRANVAKSVSDLQVNSEILPELIKQGNLKIVGADYSLETGEVTFHESE